jgi:phosphoglycerol transferase
MIANAPPASLPDPKGSGRTEWPWWVLLFLIVILLWCTAYNRWTADSWRTPIVYDGDVTAVLANAKAFASGEIKFILPKYPASLGAPFVANWNDYPSPAEGIFLWAGLFVRLFGIFIGSNLTLLSAYVLAAASFYFVARELGYQRLLSLAGAVVFSMSRFSFARNLSHIGPVFYWHVPLALLVLWWCGGPSSVLRDKRKLIFCFAVAVVHGIQDPYFSGIFLQFLVFTSVILLMRREAWSRVLFPLLIASAVLAVCVLMNVDTFYNRLFNGANSVALVRNYAALEIYALKPLELFLPALHRVSALRNWVQNAYFQQAMVLGEIGSPYLGIIGIGALGWLVWTTALAAVNQAKEKIPSHFWLVLWILIYSVIGGANGFLGLFGVILFRGTNRYSIVILAVLLLFLVRQLTTLTRSWNRFALLLLAASITVVGFLDQSPLPPRRSEIAQVSEQVTSDGRLVATLEAKLPPGAMIFELPVVVFPEAGPVREMRDYEHFRPYLQSHSLRFSYGNIKGRTRERWQTEVIRFGAPYLVSRLERYGFAAILVNKKAYDARGAALLAELSAAGRSEILCESDDLVCLRLQPASNPILPPEFDENWSDLEANATDNWRWSLGDAQIVLYNQSAQPRDMRLSFSLSSPKPRMVQISSNGKELFAHSFSEVVEAKPVHLVVNVPPGRCKLLFHTDIPAALPGNGDPRRLAFLVQNFTIED